MNNGNKKIIVLMITVRADFGGGPEQIYKLLKELHEQIDFYVACPNEYPYWQRYSDLIDESKLIEIPHRKFKLFSLFNLIRFIRKNKIDLIHSHGKGAGVYGRLAAALSLVQCIHTFHGIHTGNYNSLEKYLYISFERFLALFTKKIIAVSKSEYILIREYKISPPGKISIIENAVEMPSSIVTYSSSKLSRKKVISISRFDYAKNTGLLIGVMEELKKRNRINEFEFILLGSGPEEEKIKSLVKSKQLENFVTFIGFTSNVGDYLIKSFCYISTSRWEGMPLSVLEAMSYGIPVIATDVNGNKDLIESGMTGYLYDINFPAQAAEYLIRLDEDMELWKNISNAARLKVERYFTVAQMAENTKYLYFEIHAQEGKGSLN
jgi:glycosyltransferase involved in cell wall biosynthesis